MTDPVDRLKSALSDRYTIERELGAGGMATVYLAQDLKHDRQVAVKVLRPELAAALGAERFHQEIKIAANLHHPHILPLYDSGEADGFLYYVMPYEEGQSLRDKLAKEGELPIAEAVRILRDVVDALTHAHKHNVVHRDIKPDNVMLSDRHALVTDFGVAKAISEATGRQQLTTEGVALGTPTYMAPEQAAADPHIDHRADIYAVGVVAYELLTGRTPFLGTTPQMILSAHMTDTPDPVSKYRESVPPALEQLVLKCLEKKAADRWQTAEELLPQLEALATPSGGVTPTGTMPVDRVAKRKWMMAGGAVAVAVVLAVILVVTLLPRGSSLDLNPNHVVVAVFRNATGDPSLDQLGERVGHWVTQGLQQAEIPVTPWDIAIQSSEYVQAEAEAGRVRNRVLALAEETGAGVVISGAIYPVEGDSIEVQVDLTDAERGTSLGTIDPLRGSLASQTSIISDVQQRVMVSLSIRFDETFSSVADAIGYPPTFEAYQTFVEGWARHLGRDMEGASTYLRRAAELDTTWAQPLIRLTVVLNSLGHRTLRDSVATVLEGYEGRLSAYEEADLQYNRARWAYDNEGQVANLRRAVELAPGSPAVYNLSQTLDLFLNRPQEALEVIKTLDPERGWARHLQWYWRDLTFVLHKLGEHEQALLEARRGYRLFPDQGAYMLRLQARALAVLGRFEELNSVLDEIEIADDLRRVREALVRTVEVLRANRQTEEAEQVLERTIDWFEARPPNEVAHVGHREWYGRALFLAGRQDEAQELFDALVDEFPDDPFARGTNASTAQRVRATRAFIAATRGDTAQALRDAAWFENLEQTNPETWRSRVAIAAVLGDNERAMQLVHDAEGQWGFPWHIQIDMLFEPLRDYPPWQEFLRPKG